MRRDLRQRRSRQFFPVALFAEDLQIGLFGELLEQPGYRLVGPIDNEGTAAEAAEDLGGGHLFGAALVRNRLSVRAAGLLLR